MKFTYMTFHLISKILDTIDVILPVFFVDKLSAVAVSIIFKINLIQYIVAGEIILIDDAIWVKI